MFVLLFLAGSQTVAGASPGKGGPAAAVNAAEAPAAAPAGLVEKVRAFLFPKRVCPECGTVVTEERSLLMLGIGLLGQVVFGSRFLVQWIASERRKESYVPVIFWYLSILGSVLLFAYALSIRAWPIILGQGLGVFIYSRNLVLISRARGAEPAADRGAEQ